MTNVTNSSASFTTISTPFIGSVSSVRFGATANDLMVTIHNYGVTVFGTLQMVDQAGLIRKETYQIFQ